MSEPEPLQSPPENLYVVVIVPSKRLVVKAKYILYNQCDQKYVLVLDSESKKNWFPSHIKLNPLWKLEKWTGGPNHIFYLARFLSEKQRESFLLGLKSFIFTYQDIKIGFKNGS